MRYFNLVDTTLIHFNNHCSEYFTKYFRQYGAVLRSPAQAIQAQIFTQAFETYRQTEILNFFLGKEVFRRPTKNEETLAVQSMQDKIPWPATDSVYIENNTLIILLEKYQPGIPSTWTGN